MARRKSIGIRSRLKGLISGQLLTKLARESGFVKRLRAINPVDFFWTVVLGFATGRERQIAGMRRAYQASTGTSLVPSSFYDRFSPALVTYLKLVYHHVVEKVSGPTHALRGTLKWLKDVFVIDATVIRLHDVLKRAFPACRTNHTKAAAKLHLVMSVVGRGPHTVQITSERTHDSKKLAVGPWCADRLLTFDLGYYRFGLFEAISRNGGYFLTRLKSNANPIITAVHRGSRGDIIGRHLQDVLPHLRRSVLDAEMEFTYRRRVYKGVRRTAHVRFRVVGVLDEETGEYHLYVTNLPVEKVTAEDVALIYRLRWQVEVTFKHLKSSFRLEDMPSEKQHIVEALIYASLLTMIVSKDLLQAVREKLRTEQQRIKEGRWVRLFNCFADRILLMVNSAPRHARELARLLEPFLLQEVIDPHRNRPSLMDQVQNGTAYAQG
jgi:putative transposase